MMSIIFKRSNIVVWFQLFIITGCVDDYDIGKKLENQYTPKVVLNCILCPDSVIKVEMGWTRPANDTVDFGRVKEFKGEITEDGKVVLQFSGSDGMFRSDIIPKPGSHYAIRCNIPEYGEVSAETYIPQPPSFTARFIESRGGKYHHFTVTEISVPQCRAVWFNNYPEYEEIGLMGHRSFYSVNSFFDQINSVNDGDEAGLKGSNIEFEDFIRIPYKNVPFALPAMFSTSGFPHRYDWIYPEGWDDLTFEQKAERWDEVIKKIYYLKAVHIQAVAPSDDYDQFCKSVYKQQYYIHIPDLPWFNENIQVYTNIKNGLGIFAGYSTAVFNQAIEVDREETK